MFDINEIRKRAQAASDAASRQLNESMEKSRKITEQMQEDMEAAQAAPANSRTRNRQLPSSARGKFSGRCSAQTSWRRWLPPRR